jgi:hypothetical protein
MRHELLKERTESRISLDTGVPEGRRTVSHRRTIDKNEEGGDGCDRAQVADHEPKKEDRAAVPRIQDGCTYNPRSERRATRSRGVSVYSLSPPVLAVAS